MSHETPTLTAQRRERLGSRYAQRLRKQGRLPAVIYGHQTDPVSVSVNAKEIINLLRHGAHAVNVNVDGASETCLVKDLQFGYLGDNLIHVDFARVNLDEEVTVNVHITYVGTPAEAKKADAIVEYDCTELPVRCAVQAIPEEIRVDLTTMEGLHLSAGSIDLPAGVALAMEPDEHIVSISFVKAAEAEGEEVEVGGEGAEPEVITEARADDEGGEA